MQFLVSLAICALFAGLVSSLDQDKHCKCRIKTSKRIIGGKVAFYTDYPWQASLTHGEQEPKEMRHAIPNEKKIDSHLCGGVIINERWVVTAAHCLIGNKLGLKPSVGVGNGHDLIKIFNEGRIYAKNVHIHPDHNEDTFENDIALLELEEPLDFSSGHVLPGCLDAQRARKNYGDLVGTGYGLTSEGTIDPLTGELRGTSSRFLKELDLQDISETENRCQTSKSEICVDTKSPGSDDAICIDDHGGPLHKTQNGLTTIVGISTLSDELTFDDNGLISLCSGKTLYTRLGYYIDWIKSLVGDEHC